MYKLLRCLSRCRNAWKPRDLIYGLEFLDRMVKAAKINIINANVRNAQTGDYCLQSL